MEKKNSRLIEAILETSSDLHRLGIMGDEEYHKITVRHLGVESLPTAKPIQGKEIRSLRERANMSQAAFARTLNLSVGYISQLERGTKQPKGPALALLNVRGLRRFCSGRIALEYLCHRLFMFLPIQQCRTLLRSASRRGAK